MTRSDDEGRRGRVGWVAGGPHSRKCRTLRPAPGMAHLCTQLPWLASWSGTVGVYLCEGLKWGSIPAHYALGKAL
jgi:hypothetical protein